MNRREFLWFGTIGAVGTIGSISAIGAAAALAAPGTRSGTTADGTAPRRRLEQQLAASRARIVEIGDRYRASGWSDAVLYQRLKAEARTFTEHHRALALLA